MAKKSAAKKTIRKPSQAALIEDVRHEQLDALCESIGKAIERRNRIARNEEADKQAALDYMMEHEIAAYHHFGTELLVRPGGNKLIARKHKDVSAMPPATMEGDEALG